jgi:predicted site-specific integrase-resolvase
MGRPKHEVPERKGSKRDWVTQQFVANHLGVSTRTVRDMSNDGRLTANRLNRGFVRYDLNEVDAALKPYGASASA